MLKPPALPASSAPADAEGVVSQPVSRNVLPGSLRDQSQKPVPESRSQDTEERCLAANNNGQALCQTACKRTFLYIVLYMPS